MSYILKGKAVYLNRLFYKFSVFCKGEARRASAAPEEIYPSHRIPSGAEGSLCRAAEPTEGAGLGKSVGEKGLHGRAELGAAQSPAGRAPVDPAPGGW